MEWGGSEMSEKELEVCHMEAILKELREIKKELQISNRYLKPVPLDFSKYLPRQINQRRRD